MATAAVVSGGATLPGAPAEGGDNRWARPIQVPCSPEMGGNRAEVTHGDGDRRDDGTTGGSALTQKGMRMDHFRIFRSAGD